MSAAEGSIARVDCSNFGILEEIGAEMTWMFFTIGCGLIAACRIARMCK